MLKKTTMLLIASIGLAASGNASAATGAELYLSKGCLACHGADAKSPIMPAYPKIAGQTTAYTAQQLKDIKTGARSNGMSAVMKGIMAGVSEEEITLLAEHLSTLK